MAQCSICGRKLPGFSFGNRKCVWCIQHEAAQRGELPDDAPQPVMPAPWQRGVTGGMGLTQALVFINVAVFIAIAATGSGFSPSPQALVRWGGNYGPLTFSGEWWRLITYNFLHGGLLHIGFNMWCLWDLGALCESLYGTWTFGALYFICGVSGGLASVGLNPARLSVGASGAIFGLAGALMAGYYLGEFSMPRVMVQARLRSVVLFVIFNIVLGGMSGSTDNMCHLGGLVAGVICGALIAKAAPSQDDVSARFAILAVALLVLTGTTVALERSRSYIFHAGRGNQLLEQNQTDDAISELRTAVRERPAYTPARITLADAYYAKGQYPEAESELKQVLAAEPQNNEAAYALGFVYLAEKKADQAKETFAKLVAKDDRLPGAHYGLGMALAAEGNHQAAVEQYQRTISMRPQFEGVHYRLGVSEAKLKHYDDAIAAFQQEEQNGDDYDNERALADAYEAKGLAAQAQQARQKAEALKQK